MNFDSFAKQILLGGNLSDKLLDQPVEWSDWSSFNLPQMPGREGRLKFSDEQFKFPKPNRLNENDKKAMALHSFANHELLAIEMMAAALLIYPHETEEQKRFKRGILSALKDEQKHLGLYISRLNELGYEFGDFPLNDFFWRQMDKLKTPSQYAAVMALTFESANLDFAQFYAKIFRSFDDEKTASILDIVLKDELSHVGFGAHWLNRWRGNKDLWNYYLQSLPWPLTPARSKGLGFDPEIHFAAIEDQSFIENLVNFDDQFRITKRVAHESHSS